MKKILFYITIFTLFFGGVNTVIAENTGSLMLNGSNQYLSTTSNPPLNITETITLECWINLTELPSTAGHNYALISRAQGSGTWSWLFDIEKSNKIRFWYSSDGSFPGDNNNRAIFLSNNPFVESNDIGKDIHIAISLDANTRTLSFYKNGKIIGSSQISEGQASSIFSGNSNLEIGSYNGGSYCLKGKIDDIRLWNIIRTAQEINDNMSNELTENEYGLVAYFKLNNNLTDSSGKNILLTNNGSVIFSTDVPFTDGVSSGDTTETPNDTTNTETITCPCIGNYTATEIISGFITGQKQKLSAGISTNNKISICITEIGGNTITTYTIQGLNSPWIGVSVDTMVNPKKIVLLANNESAGQQAEVIIDFTDPNNVAETINIQ